MSGKSITGEDVLRAVRRMENALPEEFDPADFEKPSIYVIAEQPFDPQQVTEFWAGHYNDSWAEAINKKIAEGFTTVRIQTEWCTSLGHVTKIYMVKMKADTK